MEREQIIAHLADEAVREWAEVQKWSRRHGDSMSQDPTYLLGRYHAMRDAYRATGGPWPELSARLDEVKEAAS